MLKFFSVNYIFFVFFLRFKWLRNMIIQRKFIRWWQKMDIFWKCIGWLEGEGNLKILRIEILYCCSMDCSAARWIGCWQGPQEDWVCNLKKKFNWMHGKRIANYFLFERQYIAKNAESSTLSVTGLYMPWEVRLNCTTDMLSFIMMRLKFFFHKFDFKPDYSANATQNQP